MIILFCQFFVPQENARALEIAECLQRNIENPYVDELRVYFEKEEDMQLVANSPRVVKKILRERMTYGFWLQETDRLPKGSISVLINADIYLTDTIGLLKEHQNLMKEKGRFIALTRYNPARDELGQPTAELILNSEPHWTQDAWAIARPDQLFHPALIQEAAFQMGQPGCDNKIAYVMHSYGFSLCNPSYSVKAVHLQKDEVRSYDRKAGKLLGIHALVSPVESLMEESALEFQILTRSPHDFKEIKLNNWINDRKSLFLRSEKSQNTNEHLIYKKIKRGDINLSGLSTVLTYSDDVYVLADDKWLFFYDENWPTVNLARRTLFADGDLVRGNFQLFATGYLPFDFSLVDVDDQMRSAQDLYFWQYPCRTEQLAFESHLALGIVGPSIRGNVIYLYVPLPWATMIDKKIFPQETLSAYQLRVTLAKQIATECGFQLKVHTVCQHIRWRELQSTLETVGITDLWISHKERGLDHLGDISLHPWSLYAVNYLDKSRCAELVYKSIEEKQLLASFVGAHMPNYLTDVRQRLAKLDRPPNVHIELKPMWHFEEFVYKYLRKGQVEFKESLATEEAVYYNKILSESVFSMCPSGSGPNSLRLWESLAVGSIPVILSDKLELPQISAHAPQCNFNFHDAVIFHPENNLESLFQRLEGISIEDRKKMQNAGLKIFSVLENMLIY